MARQRPDNESLDVQEPALMAEGAPGPTDMMVLSPELATMLRHQLGLSEDAGLPELDTFLSQCGVLGKGEDLQWLVAVCCRPGETRAHLNLGRVRQHIERLKEEADATLARSMQMARQVKAAATAAPSLDEAADLFYAHCYPEVQDCMDIAVEQLQQPRSRIMLAALGHFKDELHGVDITNTLEANDMVATPRRGTVTPFPGNSQAGWLQRQCPVCETTFQPEKDKPKQLYCRQQCGDFAYASLQTWAFNAAAYAGMEALPWPDSYQYGIPPERMAEARAWQETEVPKALEQHRIRIREQRVRG